MNNFSCIIPDPIYSKMNYSEIMNKIAEPYRGKEEIEKMLMRIEYEGLKPMIIITLYGNYNIRVQGIRELRDISYLGLEEQTQILTYFFMAVWDSYIQERIKQGYFPVDLANDLYAAMNKIAEPYRGKEEIEKMLMRIEYEGLKPMIIITLYGNYNIRVQGIRELRDISYLGLEEQTQILTYFFMAVWDSYIQERIKQGYFPVDLANDLYAALNEQTEKRLIEGADSTVQPRGLKE